MDGDGAGERPTTVGGVNEVASEHGAALVGAFLRVVGHRDGLARGAAREAQNRALGDVARVVVGEQRGVPCRAAAGAGDAEPAGARTTAPNIGPANFASIGNPPRLYYVRVGVD